MTNSNYKFWKSVSFVLVNILVFFLGGIITLISPVADYYRDGPLISKRLIDLEEETEKHNSDFSISDKRLADLEDRVDRNDQRFKSIGLDDNWNMEWEKQLRLKRQQYEPLLESARK